MRGLGLTLVSAALVAAACSNGGIAVLPSTTTTLADAEPANSDPSPDESGVGVEADDGPFTLRVGVVGMPATFDPLLRHVAEVESHLFGLPSVTSLYRTVPPTNSLIPYVVEEDEPPSPTLVGEEWISEVTVLEGVTWNDGTQLTAADVAASFRGFRSMGPSPWERDTPLVDVRAVDRLTVQLVWERPPTVEEWHFGVALAPILPADTRFSFGPHLDSPTVGPYVLKRLPAPTDTTWSLVAVDGWWEAGASFEVWGNGAVRYNNPALGIDEEYGRAEGQRVAAWTEGPYADVVEFSLVPTPSWCQARLTVGAGTHDLLLLENGVEAPGEPCNDGGDSQTIQGARHPLPRSMAAVLNVEGAQTDDQLIRSAIACLIGAPSLQSSFLGRTPLQAATIPGVYTPWATLSTGCGEESGERFDAALELLRSAGWEWENEPTRTARGTRLRTAAGRRIPEFTILTWTAALDPVRYDAALSIEAQLQHIGLNVTLEEVDPANMADRLGQNWNLVMQTVAIDAYPAEIATLLDTAGLSQELDDDATSLSSALNLTEAELAFTLFDDLLKRDHPFVLLYTPTILEAYGPRITMPVDSALGGWQAYDGMLSAVQPADG